MKYRATIGLTIDIDSERDMGLEIDDSGIEEYVIESLAEYIYELSKTNDLYDVIKVEKVKEEDNE
jgi:hypothetical protein